MRQRVRSILLFILILFLGVAKHDELFYSAFKNKVYLAYSGFFRNNALGKYDLAELRTWLEFLIITAQTTERDKCLLANIYGYMGSVEEASLLWESGNGSCAKIITVPIGRIHILLSDFVSSEQLYQQENAEIEFRRNGSVWETFYFVNSGIYELGVNARCIGPVPAMLRLSVDHERYFLEFDAELNESIISDYFNKGLHRISFSFMNDYQGQGGDRNLRIKDVWIEYQYK